MSDDEEDDDEDWDWECAEVADASSSEVNFCLFLLGELSFFVLFWFRFRFFFRNFILFLYFRLLKKVGMSTCL